MQDDTQAPEQDAPVETTATDTAETQASEASKHVEQQAPEATQAEAPKQTEETQAETEVKAEDTAQEEKLYAGKYKSVEDMEKAYQELNSKFSQTTSEKAELAKILNEAFMSPEQTQQAPQPTQSPDTDYDDYQEDSNPLKGTVDKLERQSAVQNFIFSHPDADASAMQKVLSEDSMIQQMPNHEAKLEYAYLKSQSLTTGKTVEEAKKQAAQQTHAKIAEKQTAKVESARKAEPTDEKAELRNKANTGTPDERKQARLDYIKKYMTS